MRCRGKHNRNHVKASKACFNYGKIGHFTDDCTELNKVLSNYFSRFLCYVSSQVLISHSLFEWIVGTRATDYVARNRIGFVEYRRVSVGNQKMITGNGTSVEVLGIGTYKLQLRQ